MKPVGTWAVYDDGVRVYVDGKQVHTIPAAEFHMLVLRVVEKMLDQSRGQRGIDPLA